MKSGDFGIDTKTGHHDKILTQAENRFLGLLWTDHVGENNKISADELALKFHCATQGFEVDPEQVRTLRLRKSRALHFDVKKRIVRHFHNHLLTMHDNIPILSRAGNGGGYWIAKNKEEAETFYATFRKRGMTGLVKASRGKKAALIDMMQQLTFEFEDMATSIGIVDNVDISNADTAISVVDSFLGRMLENPEKFSGGLKKLSKKYGSILLNATEVAEMKNKAAELSNLVASLGV